MTVTGPAGAAGPRRRLGDCGAAPTATASACPSSWRADPHGDSSGSPAGGPAGPLTNRPQTAAGQPSATSAAIRRPGLAAGRAAPIRIEGSRTLRPIACSEASSGAIHAVRRAPVRRSCSGSAWCLRERPPQRDHGEHDVAARREVGVGGRAHAAVDVVAAVDLDRRPDERDRAARGDACSRSTSPCGRRPWNEPLSASTAVIFRSRSGQPGRRAVVAPEPGGEHLEPVGPPVPGAPSGGLADPPPASCGRCPAAASGPSRVSCASRVPNSAPSSALGRRRVCSAYRSSRSSPMASTRADDRARRGADDQVGAVRSAPPSRSP